MADREKVINELVEHIESALAVDSDYVDCVRTDLLQYTVALLKEQEPVKVRHLHGTKVSMHEEIVFTDQCEYCGGYLLKPWKACPICGRMLKWDET